MKIPEQPHSCLHRGHIWIEADGSLYVRHRDRQGSTDVTCLYCDVTAALPMFGKATMPFAQEVQKATAVLRQDRAVREKIDATKATFALTSAPAKDIL